MYTITEIKKPIYLNKEDYAYMLKYKDKVQTGSPKKTRGVCIAGVVKNEKCYHVVLDEEYLRYIQKKYCNGGTNAYDHTGIYIQSVIQDIFPDKHMFVNCSDTRQAITKIVSNFKYNTRLPDPDSSYWQNVYGSDTLEFDVWDMDNWIECPKTKTELDKLKAEEERKSIEKVNVACLTDTIITALKEADINVALTQRTYQYKNRAYMQVIDKKEWNKLLLKAINVYLNDIANKYGFKVAMPKIKSNANINEYCPLFFLDNIEMLDEGEQK